MTSIESRVLADLKKILGTDKVTREQYINFIYMGEPPEEWTAEDEADMPEELRDWSKVGRKQ